jgi:hypothetical protein
MVSLENSSIWTLVDVNERKSTLRSHYDIQRSLPHFQCPTGHYNPADNNILQFDIANQEVLLSKLAKIKRLQSKELQSGLDKFIESGEDDLVLTTSMNKASILPEDFKFLVAQVSLASQDFEPALIHPRSMLGPSRVSGTLREDFWFSPGSTSEIWLSNQTIRAIESVSLGAFFVPSPGNHNQEIYQLGVLNHYSLLSVPEEFVVDCSVCGQYGIIGILDQSSYQGLSIEDDLFRFRGRSSIHCSDRFKKLVESLHLTGLAFSSC